MLEPGGAGVLRIILHLTTATLGKGSHSRPERLTGASLHEFWLHLTIGEVGRSPGFVDLQD